MDCGGKQLEQKGCYWDRPAHELVFTTHSDHMKNHYQRRKTRMKKARDKSLEKTDGRLSPRKKFTIELDTGETILAESINQLSKALNTPYAYAWARVKELDQKSFIVIKHAIIRKASPEHLQTIDRSTQMNPDLEEAASNIDEE